MVHLRLKGAVEVGECLGRGAEAHLLAEVVPPLQAQIALAAIHAALDGDAHADLQAGLGPRARRGRMHVGGGSGAGEGRAERGDDTGGLVAEDEGRLEREVAVAAVGEIVEVGAAEGGVSDEDGCLAGSWGPECSLLDAEVRGTVADGGGGRWKRHC